MTGELLLVAKVREKQLTLQGESLKEPVRHLDLDHLAFFPQNICITDIPPLLQLPSPNLQETRITLEILQPCHLGF